MPGRSREPSAAFLSSPGEVSRRALGRLLRGGTWPALAREVAWEAVRSSGVEPSCLDWLTSLVEARLAERVDGLTTAVERHDGLDDAAEILSRAYVEVLEWAIDLLDDRAQAARTATERPRLRPLRRLRPRRDAAIPEIVADDLLRVQDRSGRAPPEREAAA